MTATLSDAGLRDGDVVDAVAQPGTLAATYKAFVWHVHGGEVVTRIRSDMGGDSCKVQEKLRNVQHIHTAERAFAVILASGAVVT